MYFSIYTLCHKYIFECSEMLKLFKFHTIHSIYYLLATIKYIFNGIYDPTFIPAVTELLV